MNEELIVTICDKIKTKMPDVDVDQIRGILDEVLYNYQITPMEHGLSVINNMMDKISLYLATKRLDGLAKGTLINYKQRLTLFAAYMNRNIEDVTSMDIRQFLAAYGTRSGCQKSTMATMISTLKSFFVWLQDNEYIIKNPMRQIKQTKTEKRMRKSMTEEELERLRDACQTPLERAIVEMYYATGCRLTELIAIDLKDIDWHEMTMRVIGKGSKERQVFFTPKARLHLEKYLFWRGSRQDSDPLFMTVRDPHRMQARRIQEIIDVIAKRAGFERSIHPHLLRHTNATLALKHGASLTTIQTLLGHSDASTTLVYAKIDADTVRHEYRRSVAQ